MYNKSRLKAVRNHKNKKSPSNYTINQNKEPQFYTKMKFSAFKIDLTEASPEEFIYRASDYYYNDLIYKKYFEKGELFSLNKNSSYKDITKINILLDELKNNDDNSPRVIFFQSPPMIGISYIIKYFNQNNFKFHLWNNSFGNENKKHYAKYYEKGDINCIEYKDGTIFTEYEKMKSLIDVNICENNNKNTFFVVIKNLPYELFIMSLKDDKYSVNFIKSWKSTISLFYELINNILISRKYSNIKFIFFTEDEEIDEFELKTIFPNKIIEHPLTKIIICNPISQRRINDILRTFLGILIPQIFEESQCKNIIESIYLEYGSNIQQILDYLILEINTRYYLTTSKYNRNKTNQQFGQLRPLTQKGKYIIQEYSENHRNSNSKLSQGNNNNSNSIINFQIKKEQQLDHDLFRLLGKLLYNKRYVKNKNAIQKLKKEEFGNNYETPRYYDINELINEIPISNHSFNELLIYNSMDHFNDVGEYADISDLYSFSDTIDNFDAFLYDKNNHYFYNNSYMRTYLNCLGVTSYNLSQYNSGKKYKFNPFIEKGLMTIKKPDIKINKNMNKFSDTSFFKSCEYYPSLISLNIKCFYKEGFYDLYKMNLGLESNDNKTRKINKNKDNNNIQLYYKEKERKKILEENEDDSEINKNKTKNELYKNSSKHIKMRNIPEEDRKAMANMFNDNDESDDEADYVEE